MMTVMERIAATYLVPVVVMDDSAKAVDAAKALQKGGVDIMEITLRTGAGLASIEAVAKNCPEIVVGAGTVLTLEQCKEAIAHGAKFIVAPGLDLEIVEHCLKNNVDVLPGCVTPTEITAALKAGLSVLKFFPANIYGGLSAIKALAGPFPQVKFVPTGGAGILNLAEFVTKEVFAVGGGFLCERKAVNAGDFESITATCANAVKIVKEARGF